MTPQQAYEKRYANVDNGCHIWDAAPPHVQDLWLAAWTIAWSMAEHEERAACASLCEQEINKRPKNFDVVAAGLSIRNAIRSRG